MPNHNLARYLATFSPKFVGVVVVSLALILALALLPLSILAALIGYGALVLFPLCDPVFGLYWVILSVPIQETIHLPGGFSYTQAALLLALFAWALRVCAHPEQRLQSGRLLPLWSVFLWALLLSAAFSPYSRVEGVKETLRWFESFLIWFMVINLVKQPWQIVGLIACLLLAPTAEALLGLVQFMNGDGPASFRIAANLPFVRAYGTHGQPNSFAGYLNMAWPLACTLGSGLAVHMWQKPRYAETTTVMPALLPRVHLLLVLLLWLVTGILGGAILASLSRGAWVGALVGMLGIAVALGRRARYTVLALLGVGIVLLLFGGVGLLPSFLAQRLASVVRYVAIFDAGSAQVTAANFAVVERMSQMQAGWYMFLAYPLTGVGPGNYTSAYPDFAVGDWFASRGQAHNYYIHIAAEAGAIGFIAYMALLTGVVYQARRTLRRVAHSFWSYAAFGCCGIIAAVIGHDMFENLHVLSMGIQLAAAWGLLFVLEQNAASTYSEG